MTIISGGAPGGWHGGMLPGASSPFRFQFDKNGEADVDGEIAAYLMSVPGPFALVVEYADEQAQLEGDVQEPEDEENVEDSDDESTDEALSETATSTETPTPKPKSASRPNRSTSARRKSLD